MVNGVDSYTYPEKIRRFIYESKRSWQLYLFFLIPLIYLLVFCYYPMLGLQIAFKNYSSAKGIWGSEWVGFDHFITFFRSYQFKRVFLNTLRISFYNIAVSFPLPVIFALFLNIVRNQRIKKLVQTITYMPHFISVVVIVGILYQVFNNITGLYGTIYRLLGGSGYPPDLFSKSGTFIHMFVWSGVWQHLGFRSIIYLSALSSVDPELHESAQIDGASRLSRLYHIDLATILPTVSIMLILRFGQLMSIGFEKIYLMQNSINLTQSEVISTYIYKVGLKSVSSFSYGAAIGMFNSVINCAMLVIVNAIARKIRSEESSLW
jgi:putative aldouronate transport system permease protein